MSGLGFGVLFEEPLWLLAFPAAAALLAWAWRLRRVRIAPARARAVQVLRLAALACLALALAGLTWWRRTDRLTVVFAVDRSRSVSQEGRAEIDRLLREAAGALPPGDRAGVIAFGGDAMVDTPPAVRWEGGEVLARPDADATDLEGALRLALGLFPPGHERRLVLLTDGVETRGSLEDGLLGLADPPDVVWKPLAAAEGPEVLVERIVAPDIVQEGQPHRVRVVVRSSRPTEAVLRVFRGATPVAASNVQLEPGRANVFAFEQDASAGSGVALYRARIEAVEDGSPRNNRASALTRIRGRPRVLLLDEDPEALRPLALALRDAGMQVERAGPEALPADALGMAGLDALLLSDVPSPAFSDGQLEGIRTWVEAFGGGLLMTGGPGSFGPGGYWHTPVEEVLPVDMEVKDRTYFPSLGIVLAIDKSGSMAGMARAAKIEVAKRAAAEVARNLQPMDQLGVIAFDSAAKWVVPLTTGDQVETIIGQIGTLRAGGGTDGYPALVEAHEALREADVRVTHVLLLTDGQMPERDYGALLAEMERDRITVSTVAVGTDADNYTLHWIAEHGGGRFYEARDIDRLPRIFLREAFHVARSWILEEPFTPVRRGSHPALTGLPLEATPPLLGYVAASEKPAARHPLGTPKGDPLLSLWRTGLGKSVAFTSDPKGRWGAAWLGWSGYAPFWSRIVRWSLRDDDPDRIQASARVEGGRLHVAADVYDEVGGFANGAEMTALVVGPDGERHEIGLRQTGPGRYEAHTDAGEPGPYLTAVLRRDAPGGARGATAAAVAPYSDEFRTLGRTASGLERLVEAGRAEIYRDLESLYRHRGEGGRIRWPLWPWLLAAAAALLVLEVAARKLRDPRIWWRERRRLAAEARPAPSALAGLRRARDRADRRMQPASPSAERSAEPGAAARETEKPPPAETKPRREEKKKEDDTQEPASTTSRLLDAKRRRK